MPSSNNSITHVIFDFDGLICNTVQFVSESFEKACSSQGLKIPHDIKVAEFGSFGQLQQLLLQKFGEESHQIMKTFIKEFSNISEDCIEFLPGVMDLIKSVRKSGIHIAIATGGSMAHFSRMTQKFGDFFTPGVNFEHIVFGNDVEVIHPKPHPDILQVCASRFKVGPKHASNVLVFDDSIVGMKAAKEANMIGVWIVDQRFHGICKQDEKYADLILGSMLEFESNKLGINFD